MRDRLVLLGKTVFLLSFTFLVLMVLSVVVLGHMPFRDVVRMPVATYHLLASSMMGLLWLFASRPATSRAWLGALDAISVVMGGFFLGLMSLSSSFKVQEAMGAVTVTTMARAVLVPSRPMRTAVISALAFLLFFWSHYLDGTAGWLEALLFVAGVSCLLLEIFVIPGFGIFGQSAGLHTFGNLAG